MSIDFGARMMSSRPTAPWQPGNLTGSVARDAALSGGKAWHLAPRHVSRVAKWQNGNQVRLQ